MRIAALCAGYGGLEMAVQNMFDADVSWYAEYDADASKVLTHHLPGVPNIGDITSADWASLPAVDVLTAGFPCQDISHAGPRTGISGSRSGIWKNVVDAVSILRPGLVFLENVAAIKRRGLDVVVSDMASIGYGVQWTYLRASDIGASHQRHRWFAVARPGGPTGELKPDRLVRNRRTLIKTPTANIGKNGAAQDPRKRRAGGHGPTLRDEICNLLPTPTTREGKSGPGRSPKRTGGDNLRTVINLLPTPKASDGPKGGPNQRDAAGNYYLPGVVNHLLPTPGTAKVINARPLNETIAHTESWICVDGKDFGPAVRRWESITGRSAPRPVIYGPRGGKKTSPYLVEWMMGLPEGHVTDVPDLSVNKMLVILGNGVVPAQAEAAYRSIMNVRLAGSGENHGVAREGAPGE